MPQTFSGQSQVFQHQPSGAEAATHVIDCMEQAIRAPSPGPWPRRRRRGGGVLNKQSNRRFSESSRISVILWGPELTSAEPGPDPNRTWPPLAQDPRKGPFLADDSLQTRRNGPITGRTLTLAEGERTGHSALCGSHRRRWGQSAGRRWPALTDGEGIRTFCKRRRNTAAPEAEWCGWCVC